MQKVIIHTAITFLFFHLASGQVNLQCPPCLPVKGCDQCWASMTEAQDNGCSMNAARVDSDELNLVLAEASPIIEAIIYPNPSHDGFFTIESLEQMNGHIRIVDPSGRIIDRYTLNAKKTFRFAQRLYPGLYFMIFEDTAGKVGIRKLFVMP